VIDRTFGWAAVASGSNRPLIVLYCTPNLRRALST
jgi:hypothetical protein